MKKWLIAVIIVFLIIAIFSTILVSTFYFTTNDPLKHDTDRWAVIKDNNGDQIALEPTSDFVWQQLTELHQNQSTRWIGGIVERYNNKWGFRFKPENITIAEVTAEGLQATIKRISEELDYWLNLRWAYVSAKVTEIHSPTILP